MRWDGWAGVGEDEKRRMRMRRSVIESAFYDVRTKAKGSVS